MRTLQVKCFTLLTVIPAVLALAAASMSAVAAADDRRSFEAASVVVPGAVSCMLRPEGSADPKQTIRVGVSADGVARFSALRPLRSGDVAILTLDCTDGHGHSQSYPVDLQDKDVFGPRPFDPVQAKLDTRPALTGDPLSYTVKELIDQGYGLRPDPKANPDGYARWLRAATMPTHLLRRSNIGNSPSPIPVIDDALPSTSMGEPRSLDGGVTVGQAGPGGSNPAWYWTGAIINGSYQPNANPARAKYYLANEGVFNLPNITLGGGDYSGPSFMSIWTGLDNVFQSIVWVQVTSSGASAYLNREFHYPKSPDNPAQAGDNSGITFTPNLGDEIYAEEWYCDANGNPVISGGYACTHIQDLNPSNNQTWDCSKANSSTCASYWMKAGDVVGTQAEYIIENDSEQDGKTYYWPDFISTPVKMSGSALVVTGANTVDSLSQGSGWVTVSTDSNVNILTDAPPSTLPSSLTNPVAPAYLVVGLTGSDGVTWTYTPILTACAFSNATTACTPGYKYDPNTPALEETYTISCNAASGWSMKELSAKGQWKALANRCSGDSQSGSCPGADIVKNEFVLGVQEQGKTTSGAKIGSLQTVMACDGSGQCSKPFQLTVSSCNTPADELTAEPSVLGCMEMDPTGFCMATISAGGPWVAGDQYCHGLNSVGGGCDVTYSMSHNLPAGVTAILNQEPPVTVSISVPFDTPITGQTYSVKVVGTDSVSGVTHTLTIPVTIVACQNASLTYGPGACGYFPKSCGGTTYVDTCTSSAPTCYQNQCTSCTPQRCATGLVFDPSNCTCAWPFSHAPVQNPLGSPIGFTLPPTTGSEPSPVNVR